MGGSPAMSLLMEFLKLGAALFAPYLFNQAKSAIAALKGG